MKTARKLICLLLALALVAAWLPAEALAVTAAADVHTEAAAQFGYAAATTRFNPFYHTAADAATVDRLPSLTPSTTTAINGYPTDLQKPAKLLRDGMVSRQYAIGMRYAVPAGDFDGSQEAVDALIDSIFNAAVVHTGVPNEGDALLWVYNYYQAGFYYNYVDGYYLLDITFNVDYYTTAAQEAELDVAVANVLAELAFTEQTSDHEKVKGVYDYICAHVVYDYNNLINPDYLLQYTAYAALVNGTSVCQGYAVLLYRLLLELGIDCRVITGIGNGGPHSWNIVKLGDYYYNADATWDAGLSEYGCFLRCEENFVDHTRDEAYTTGEFTAQYPMDPLDFDPENSAATHTHQYESAVTAPTCTAEGYTTYTCTVCGKSYTGDATEMLPHSYDDGVVTEPSCTGQGIITYTCTACGATKEEHFGDPLPHSYDEGVVTEPTCTSAGFTLYTCTVCGAWYRDNYVPEAHNYVDEVTAVTCTKHGYTTHTCSYCGDTYTTDWINPTGHTLGEDYLCTVCGSPEYVFDSELYVRTLVLGEDGVYYNAHGKKIYVAVTLPLDRYTADNTLAHNVSVFGEPHYSLTYWDQILASLNADGCMVLTEETLVWILDLLQGNTSTGPEDWMLNYYLCYVLDHAHEYETVTTPATCTEFGRIAEVCVHCGLVDSSTSIAPGHTYDEGIVDMEPTCNSLGRITYTCTVCGYSYWEGYGSYTDHTYGEEGVVTPPTCTSEGYTTYTCTVCGAELQGDYEPMLEHTPDESCACTVCGAKVYLIDCGLTLDYLVLGDDGVYYTPHGDMVVIAVTAPLDVYLNGYSLAECVEAYGSYYFSMTYWDELLDAVNEDGYAPLTEDTLVWMLDLITGNPNWGETEEYLTFYIGIPIDHTHIYEEEITEPTCTEMGLSVYTCNECGLVKWEYTEPLGHVLDENYTCTVCGENVAYVMNCGLQLEDLILGEDGIYYTADGHMVVIAVTAPLDYWLGGQSLYDYVYIYGKIDPPPAGWELLLEMVNEDGYAPLSSSSYVWLRDVHVWLMNLITGNPVWDGSEDYLTHYIGFSVKCDHSYGEGVVTAPTCTADGCTTYTCTRCGHSYTADTVPALGHSHEAVVTPPTCTEAGFTTYTCACGDSYTADFVEPTGHTYVDGVCACGAREETAVKLGDVNGDGEVNTRDAKLIMQYELGLLDATGLDLAAADVNGDGEINTRDAKLIMQYELGLIDQFPGQA